MLYKTTVLNLAMKPAAPPVLHATRLLDQIRERIRYKHYSLRTEQAYVQWVRMFVKWHGLRHPRDMGRDEIEAFLAMLANERRVAASTHNQALSALLFLYREVLGVDLPWLDGVQRPRTPKRIPSVLTVAEVAVVLAALPPDMALLARLLYGTGMRLMEGMRLRIKDVDFDRSVIVVRQAKGDKDRVVMLPRSLAADLRQQVLAARAQWEHDRQAQRGGVEVPHALEAKYPQVGDRAFGCKHHHDLHPCLEACRRGHHEPVGCHGLKLVMSVNSHFRALTARAALGRKPQFVMPFTHKTGTSRGLSPCRPGHTGSNHLISSALKTPPSPPPSHSAPSAARLF